LATHFKIIYFFFLAIFFILFSIFIKLGVWVGEGEEVLGVENILLEKFSVIGHTQLQWQKKQARTK
jgi:hypothetical protein